MNKFTALIVKLGLLALLGLAPTMAAAEVKTEDAIRTCDRRAQATNDCDYRNAGTGVTICVGVQGGFKDGPAGPKTDCSGGTTIDCGGKGGTCICTSGCKSRVNNFVREGVVGPRPGVVEPGASGGAPSNSSRGNAGAIR